jgi:hypothetical protein
VTEQLGAIQQEGILETSNGHAEVAEMSLPPTLRLTILRRLSFLPEETVQPLGPPRSWDPASLSLSDLLTEAIAAGVLADDGVLRRSSLTS